MGALPWRPQMHTRIGWPCPPPRTHLISSSGVEPGDCGRLMPCYAEPCCACCAALRREKEYYLASAFKELYAPPSAYLSLRGFTAGGTFLRGVLDKVGGWARWVR